MAGSEAQLALALSDDVPARNMSTTSVKTASSWVHPRGASEVLIHSIVGDADVRQTCCCKTTGNMRVLFLTATLFIIITTAQAFAAQAANSKALLADCYSMGVDAATYFLNMIAEKMRGSPVHRPLELFIALISQGVLVYFCISIMLEALDSLSGDPGGGGDEVDPVIVLTFAIFGLIFDFISLCAFMRNAKSGESLGVNMTAALMHVGADLLRSATTFVEGLILLAIHSDGGNVDAYACLIVSATIVLGVVFALFEWIKDLIFYCKHGRNGDGD